MVRLHFPTFPTFPTQLLQASQVKNNSCPGRPDHLLACLPAPTRLRATEDRIQEVNKVWGGEATCLHMQGARQTGLDLSVYVFMYTALLYQFSTSRGWIERGCGIGSLFG
jgi:hypothetical protein